MASRRSRVGRALLALFGWYTVSGPFCSWIPISDEIYMRRVVDRWSCTLVSIPDEPVFAVPAAAPPTVLYCTTVIEGFRDHRVYLVNTSFSLKLSLKYQDRRPISSPRVPGLGFDLGVAALHPPCVAFRTHISASSDSAKRQRALVATANTVNPNAAPSPSSVFSTS